MIYDLNSPEVEGFLDAILAVLNGGANWTKKANARDINDLPVPALNAKAVKWDIFGAIMMAQKNTNQPNFGVYHVVYEYLMGRIPEDFISRDMEYYNDITDWDGILALLGRGGSFSYVRATADGKLRAMETDGQVRTIG